MGPTEKRFDHDAKPAASAAADAHARLRNQKQPGERRSGEDRRVRFDRRDMIRFEADRRAGFDRRVDVDPWSTLE